ncbi:hypothetical protein VTK56DRAFT_6299 [Thermocarpiscus australiensis]
MTRGLSASMTCGWRRKWTPGCHFGAAASPLRYLTFSVVVDESPLSPDVRVVPGDHCGLRSLEPRFRSNTKRLLGRPSDTLISLCGVSDSLGKTLILRVQSSWKIDGNIEVKNSLQKLDRFYYWKAAGFIWVCGKEARLTKGPACRGYALLERTQ